MNHNRLAILLGLALTAGFTIARFAHAEETLKEKVVETAKDVKKSVKKGARAASDAACPVVDGEIKCGAKKLKHKAQNAADEATK